MAGLVEKRECRIESERLTHSEGLLENRLGDPRIFWGIEKFKV
jgi:hypothetical protein